MNTLKPTTQILALVVFTALVVAACGPSAPPPPPPPGPTHVGTQPVAPSGGGFCNTDNDCTPPYYCILGTCRTLGQAGSTCKWDADCVEGLYCPGGLCAGLGNIGAPCKSWSHCVAPLACFNFTCSQCTIGGVSSTIGDACCDDTQCNQNLAEPLYCILGTCRPIGGAGCSCGVFIDCDSQFCDEGYCVGGAACWEFYQGTTAPASGSGGLGAACKSYYECEIPLTCENGTCSECTVTQDGLPLGSKCCDDLNCVLGSTVCILGVCLPLGQAGAACGINEDCLSGSCSAGACQ